jgi:heat-inducible transcriptional repressor
VLEQEGYLAQPHTSAGRIPTDKGYRFFVDHMASPGRLDSVASQRVGDFFDAAHGRLEEMLHQTSNLLSQLTRNAALVVGPPADKAVVRSVQLVGLSARMAVVVAVFSNGSVENETVELSADTSELRLSAASSHLQAVLGGRVLDPATPPSSGDPETDEVCRAAHAALIAAGSEESVYLGGTAVMAQSFDAVDTVRTVLETLEQQYVMVSLVRDVLNRGLSVAIGSEHGIEPLAACSVVVAPVVVDGEHLGSVGVLGPTRMDYPQALATVEVVSERLGRHLGEGAG